MAGIRRSCRSARKPGIYRAPDMSFIYGAARVEAGRKDILRRARSRSRSIRAATNDSFCGYVAPIPGRGSYEMKRSKWNSPRLQFVAGLLCLSATAAIAQSVPNPCDPRGLYPGQFVYDAGQQVCWLADANLAGKPAMQALFNVSGI